MKKDVFYFNSLGVQLYLSDLLDPCKTEEQVERIREQIEGCLEIVVDEKLEEIKEINK